MAIDPLVYSPKQTRLFIAEEATFGTAVTDATAWADSNTDGVVMLKLVDTPTFPDFSGMTRDSSIRSHGQLVKKHTDVFVSRDASGNPLGEFTMGFDVICTEHDIDILLAMCNITTVEAATTPFQKTFTLDKSTTQPDFGANAGQFHTVTLEDPLASENDVLTSAIIKTLTLSSVAGTNGGRLSASGTFYSGFSWTQSNLAPATTVVPDTDYYDHVLIQTKTLNALDLILESWTLTIETNCKRIGNNTSGNAETYSLGVPEFPVTGSISAKYDSKTKDAIDDFIAGTDRAFEILYGTAGADGGLNIKANVVHTGPTKEYGNEAGMFVTMPFETVDDGTNAALLITQTNTQDRGW